MIRLSRYICALAVCMLAISAEAFGQNASDTLAVGTVRPVISAFTADVGFSLVLDTYLSPIRYHGLDLRLGYERLQAMRFAPSKWVMQMDAAIEYQPTRNPAHNHHIHAVMGDFKWGMMHRWYLTPRLQAFAGASTQFRGGVLYLPGNSNNIISFKLHWSVNATAMAAYRVKVLHCPITLRYQATLPLAGIFFSPEYGESYYEIYVGNHSNLVRLGWWGNRFDMVNLLTADMHFGATTLRVGYRNQVETSWVSNLNTQFFTNSLVIGLCGEWMSLRPGKQGTDRARVISALY